METPKKPYSVALLTFKDGKFFLTGAVPKDADAWRHLSNFTGNSDYLTTDIRAAARFRQSADEAALAVLKKAFVKFYPDPKRPMPYFLDDHQVEGVKWALTRSRSYLAHAPGAGKTCQAITAACLTKASGQVVFVVPPTLTVNWEREIMKFWDLLHPMDEAWPEISVIPDSSGQDYTGWKAEFLIVPDSMIAKPWVLNRLANLKKRFLAVDEASRFKEAGAIRTRALFGGRMPNGSASPGLLAGTAHAVLLDGSPMPNRPLELWAPTYAMSPESIDFMAQNEFGFRYGGPTQNNFGRWEFKRSSHEDELQRKLTHSFMHVVSEESLEHPERRRSLLFMNEDARSAAHRSWERKHLSKIKFSDLNEDMSNGELAHFRKELGMRKVPWVSHYVADRLTTKGESILLFAWHRDVVFELEKKLAKFKPATILGGTKDDARERAIDEFQSGKIKLLILNIVAGGRGHNLQRADRIVFAEWSWSDEANKQCEKRASRRGRDKDLLVRADYIVSPHSMDEPILNSVFQKAERVRRIIG